MRGREFLSSEQRLKIMSIPINISEKELGIYYTLTENDIEMLKCAGWSVCLKNGMDDVKAITDDITEYTSSEDGVGKYLLKNIL